MAFDSWYLSSWLQKKYILK